MDLVGISACGDGLLHLVDLRPANIARSRSRSMVFLGVALAQVGQHRSMARRFQSDVGRPFAMIFASSSGSIGASSAP